MAQLDPAERLNGVRQDQRTRLVGHFRNGCQRLADTDLVVDHHDRDHEHALIQLAFEQVENEPSVAVDRKNGEVDPLPSKPLASIEHGSMLGGYGNDPIAALGCLFDTSLE